MFCIGLFTAIASVFIICIISELHSRRTKNQNHDEDMEISKEIDLLIGEMASIYLMGFFTCVFVVGLVLMFV